MPARSFSLLCEVLGTLEHAGNVATPMHAAQGKNEGLEALSQSQSYGIIGVSVAWWEEPSDCCAVLDGYRIFKRDRQGRGLMLQVMEGLRCTELAARGDTV